MLPYGTDVTAIEPTIELSLGATVDLSGVQDFTNPVTYTVTAEDGVTTMVNGKTIKVLSWYDNEWGYSCRVVDLAVKLFK